MLKSYIYFLLFFVIGFFSTNILQFIEFEKYINVSINHILFLINSIIMITHYRNEKFDHVFSFFFGSLSCLFFLESVIVYFSIFNIYILFGFVFYLLFFFIKNKYAFIFANFLNFSLSFLIFNFYLVFVKVPITSMPVLYLYYLFLIISFFISFNFSKDKLTYNKIIKSFFSFLTIAIKKKK